MSAEESDACDPCSACHAEESYMKCERCENHFCDDCAAAHECSAPSPRERRLEAALKLAWAAIEDTDNLANPDYCNCDLDRYCGHEDRDLDGVRDRLFDLIEGPSGADVRALIKEIGD